PSVLREVGDYYRLRGRVIPYAVDTNLFRRQDRSRAREAFGLPQGATIGLFVGRPEYAKGFDVFLEVARSMRDVTFLVLGQCSLADPNVRVLEHIPHSQMPSLYSSSDFFFLPSRYEGFGLSTLEAVACEVPIVVSEAAYPFAEDPSHFGYVAGSLDPAEFVQGIREILQPDTIHTARETAIKGYSIDAFRKRWRELANRLLEHHA
ncbi:MAG: glycosyltransferase family 4 protein, partial [Thermoplasmata archaeon]